MKIFVIRHGETDWNRERKLQGQVDIPLNESGRRVARLTREGFPKEIQFDVCFSSPLSRAKETAQILLGDSSAPVIEDPRLKEMAFGIYEGQAFERGKSQIPDTFFDGFVKPETYVAPEKGESFQDLMERVRSFLSDLFESEEYKDKTVLLAAHGVTVCAIMAIVSGRTIQNFWGQGVHKNCGISEIQVEDGIPKLISENVVYCDEEIKDWYVPKK